MKFNFERGRLFAVSNDPRPQCHSFTYHLESNTHPIQWLPIESQITKTSGVVVRRGKSFFEFLMKQCKNRLLHPNNPCLFSTLNVMSFMSNPQKLGSWQLNGASMKKVHSDCESDNCLRNWAYLKKLVISLVQMNKNHIRSFLTIFFVVTSQVWYVYLMMGCSFGVGH